MSAEEALKAVMLACNKVVGYEGLESEAVNSKFG